MFIESSKAKGRKEVSSKDHYDKLDQYIGTMVTQLRPMIFEYIQSNNELNELERKRLQGIIKKIEQHEFEIRKLFRHSGARLIDYNEGL